MEEVLLLGLKDTQGYLSFWNDNISYVLRACIIMELSMRQRIALFKEQSGRHLRRPFTERLLDVVDESSTGEVILDEALKLMKQHQATQPRKSIGDWVDLLSGETWNIVKIPYQLKQVRERLAKGLVDKGVLRNEKKNFLVFEMATHPVADSSVKAEIVTRVVDCLLGRGSAPSRRTIALCAASYAANVMENALDAYGKFNDGNELSYSQKDACFARCEEMLAEWSSGSSQAFYQHQQQSQYLQTRDGRFNSQDSGISNLGGEKDRIGWTDIMSGSVGVFLRMDNVI